MKRELSREVQAPYDLIEKFGEMYSGQSLDMEDHNKSRGRVITYLKRFWVCTGSVSRGNKKLKVFLHECVPLGQWKGEFNKPNHYDDDNYDYYKGGRLRSQNGEWWVMTGYEINLVPLKNERSLFIKEKL